MAVHGPILSLQTNTVSNYIYHSSVVIYRRPSSARCSSLASVEVCGDPKGKPYCLNASLMVITNLPSIGHPVSSYINQFALEEIAS